MAAAMGAEPELIPVNLGSFESNGRNLVAGQTTENLIRLMFFEVMHDFTGDKIRPKFTQDIISQDRSRGFDYFKCFHTTIFRKANVGGVPFLSFLFNSNCREANYTSDVEAEGLRQVISIKNPTSQTVLWNDSKALETMLAFFSDYRVPDAGGKLPIVVDYQYNLKKYFAKSENIAICRNKEHFTDSARTYKRDFGPIATWDEVGSNAREYSRAQKLYINRDPRSKVVIDGNISNITIDYYLPNKIDNSTENVQPYIHTKSLCTKHASVARYESKMKNIEKENIEKIIGDQCNFFEERKEVSGDHNSNYVKNDVLNSLTVEYLKKRCGDYLQVLSCLQAIQYSQAAPKALYAGGSAGGTAAWIIEAVKPEQSDTQTFGGEEKPCILWTHDQLCAAFAILCNVPVVLEKNEKRNKKGGIEEKASITFYDPRKPPSGGQRKRTTRKKSKK